MVLPVAPRLEASTPCYCTEQPEMKSNTRENGAVCKMYEAAAGITSIKSTL